MSKQRNSYRWVGFAAAGVLAAALAGCGGGGSSNSYTPDSSSSAANAIPATANNPGSPSTNPVVAALAATGATAATVNTGDNPAQAFGAIISGGGNPITINSPPVVNFTVIDSSGKFVSGLKLAPETTAARTADTNCSGSNVTMALAKLDSTTGLWSSLISRQRIIAGTARATANPTQSAVVEGATDPKPVYISTTINKMDNTSTTGTILNPAGADKDASVRVVGILEEAGSSGLYTYRFATDVTTALAMADATDVKNVSQGKVANNGNVLVKDGKTVYRLGMQLCYTDPVTSAKTVVNPVYDFTVGTDGKSVAVTSAGKLSLARKVADKKSCDDCHQNLAAHGTRVDPNYCVICHNASSTDYNTGNAIDMRMMVHRIHRGKELGNDFKIAGLVMKATDASGNVTGTGYPQDIRNCAKCHTGTASTKYPNATAQGDNWKAAPSRTACGACHDRINFATGTGTTIAGGTEGHIGKAQADDSKCTICHTSTEVPTYHYAVTPPTAGNALLVSGGGTTSSSAYIAGNTDNLPSGAIKVSYDIKSVSVNSSGNPVIVFRLLQNGVRADFNSTTGKTEFWDNFFGGPSLYWVFAVPQDGIAKPADFNASISVSLRQLWSGSTVTCNTASAAGTLTGPDTDGYYTGTVTGSKIPTTAVMVTGGIGYTYSLPSATTAAACATMPLTQTNVTGYPATASTVNSSFKTGGLVVVAQDVSKVATGYTGRRQAVADSSCDKCHEQLGVFTEAQFHAGQRNDGPSCSWCHNPNRTSSGWSASSGYFVHAIHAGQKRSNKFTWHASSTADGYWNIKMPSKVSSPNSSNTLLRNCQSCHVAGMNDYSNAATTAAYPNMLWSTVAQGAYASSTSGYTLYNKISSTTATTGLTCGVNTATSAASALTVFAYSPFITTSSGTAVTDYGNGFSFNASGSVVSNGCKVNATYGGIATAPTATAPTYDAYSNAAQGTLEAASSTLVISPFAAVCVACHDGKTKAGTDARSHMEQQGAKIYATRKSAYATGSTSTLQNGEQCLLCHGSTGTAPIAASHAK